MDHKNINREYLENLNKAIKAMDPFDKACAKVLLHLGQIIAELMNRRDWGTIKEMSAVCAELFIQAEQLKEETSDSIH